MAIIENDYKQKRQKPLLMAKTIKLLVTILLGLKIIFKFKFLVFFSCLLLKFKSFSLIDFLIFIFLTTYLRPTRLQLLYNKFQTL